MKPLVLLSSLLLAPIVILALMTSEVAPSWVLVPALLVATAVGAAVLSATGSRTVGPCALGKLLFVTAVALLALTVVAFALDPARPFVLSAILAYAVLLLFAGAYVAARHAPPRMRDV
jgi:hypothetical protein